MSANSANKMLEKFSEDCIQCGVCQNTCALLNDSGLISGEIAQAIAQDQVSDECLAAILRCDVCGQCSQGCLVNLNPADLIKAAREVLIQKGRINLNDYDVMLVDRDWNFFSIYRDTYGISFDDLFADRYDTLFFPGCTLASYSPPLTRAAYHWMAGQGMRLGFSDLCCGKPLASIGLRERKDRLLAYLQRQMRMAGARRLVTACPNCYYQMRGQLGEMEVISLYELMSAAGVKAGAGRRLTVHDSCPDRYSESVGRDVRGLLAEHSLVEMEHHGAETICCGSGGIVSMIDPELCEGRASMRMQESDRTGAEACVTACMACAHRLAKAAQAGSVVHVLELLFAQPVDYAQLQANVRAMWEGEWGEYNQYRLSQARLFTWEDERSHEPS